MTHPRPRRAASFRSTVARLLLAGLPALAAVPAVGQTGWTAPQGDPSFGAARPGAPPVWPPLREQVPPPPDVPTVPRNPLANGGYERPLPPQYYPLPHERGAQGAGACAPWPANSSFCWHQRR